MNASGSASAFAGNSFCIYCNLIYHSCEIKNTIAHLTPTTKIADAAEYLKILFIKIPKFNGTPR